MNCKDFEKIAYLYEESEPAKKRQLERHIQICDECRELFERMMEERSSIKRLFPPDKIDFPGALAERIMAAVNQEKKVNIFERVLQIIRSEVLRYACAVISGVMVVAFLLESNGEYRGKASVSASVDGVELKSTQLLERVLTNKNRGESLIAAIKKQQGQNEANSN